MDAALQKALLDRVYEKRKAATLELEKQAREALAKNDRARINAFVQQLCSLLNSNPSSSSNPQSVNARNGGLIGLAGIGIALGVEIAAYLEQIVPPVLACFVDPDSKIRYFACESFYNIAKVCKGEILMYFNEIFDALSKLAADTELSVKNGAELLDRLLKDIVCETAPHYISQYQDISLIRARQDVNEGNVGGQAELDVAREKSHAADDEDTAGNKAFSLARFVPLLSERIYVLSPFTRNYLVSWITVLDSVPDLELVSYLPQFLDGLLKYLSDPNTDVRVATSKVLADFLREIQEAAEVARIRREAIKRASMSAGGPRAEEEKAEGEQDKPEVAGDKEDKSSSTLPPSEASASSDISKGKVLETEESKNVESQVEESWVPAQEVRIDYVAIMEILLNHIAYPDEEIQATTQQWIAELLNVVREVVIPFTPRLLPAILPNIAHHSPAIQSAANVLNISLYQVIEELEWVSKSASASGQQQVSASDIEASGSPRQAVDFPTRPPTASPSTSPGHRSISDNKASGSAANAVGTSFRSITDSNGPNATAREDLFDLQQTVNVLTVQLIDEHEETRVSALEWLLMLHQKAPRRILSVNDGTFPALLKTLSDSSEEVIRCDLRLLAQMSGASDDAYNSYLANLVNLFSTDRRLLEARGSLIIRQLCATLHTERVFRTLAEILEKDEDLEFASIMITNLNMILLTSPELGDFRKRLKNLETRDGQNLFVSLYRSWCHNAVATLSLCLLAQAYEHAANLLSTFPDLEITVPFLIQIDKLVQLLESPIFMTLRLQLLEPDRYPQLLKTLYGLLMLLPQSSAFATLRNRLNAVSALGYLHVGAGARSQGLSSSSSGSMSASAGAGSGSGSSVVGGTVGAARTKMMASSRDELKWNELLLHFKVVQGRHERARKVAALGDHHGEEGGGMTLDNATGTGTGRGATTNGLGLTVRGNEGIKMGLGGMSRSGSGGAGGTGPGKASMVGTGKRRTSGMGAASSGVTGAGGNLRSTSTSSYKQRGGGETAAVATGAGGSSSFFRLPIGHGQAAGNSSGMSTPTQANISRPTSPPISRRSGNATSATNGAGGASTQSGSVVPNLISRTMSLNNPQRGTNNR